LGLAGLVGCVSQNTYELARMDAENARLRYQQETQRTQALTEQVKQMKLQIEELETKARIAGETADRATRDYKQVRDELLAMKISQEQEQHRIKTKLKQNLKQLDQERALLELDQDLSKKYENASPETKQRVRELLQQIDGLLQQAAPR
jgi:monoamine oxidase